MRQCSKGADYRERIDDDGQQRNVLKTGTSTLGITFNGGVVVGADHRATMGHFIANKSVQKLFKSATDLHSPRLV